MNNFVVMKGRLGQDPELKETQTGKKLAKFSIAVYGNAEHTNWINVTAWNGLAKSVANELKKGDEVLVVGQWNVTKGESGVFNDLRVEDVAKTLNTWDNEPKEEKTTKKK